MTFSILASQLKRLYMWFRKKLVEHGLQSAISKISDANKMRLFKATVETIAAYGLESVPMTRSLCRQIDAFHRQMATYVY